MQFYSYNVILVLFFLITCRYFSSQAWSGGPYPIAIPQTLRSALQDTSDPQMGGTGAARTSNWDNNSKKRITISVWSCRSSVWSLSARNSTSLHSPNMSCWPCASDSLDVLYTAYFLEVCPFYHGWVGRTVYNLINSSSNNQTQLLLRFTLVTVVLFFVPSNYLPEFCSCRFSSTVSA